MKHVLSTLNGNVVPLSDGSQMLLNVTSIRSLLELITLNSVPLGLIRGIKEGFNTSYLIHRIIVCSNAYFVSDTKQGSEQAFRPIIARCKIAM